MALAASAAAAPFPPSRASTGVVAAALPKMEAPVAEQMATSSSYSGAGSDCRVRCKDQAVCGIVPEGVTPGITKLALTTSDNVQLVVRVPADASPGDKVFLKQDEHGSWSSSLVKRPQEKELSLLVPADAVPGESILQVDTGGEERVNLEVPPSSRPGDKIKLISNEFGPTGNRKWVCQAIQERIVKTNRIMTPLECIAHVGELRAPPLDPDMVYEALVKEVRIGGASVNPKLRRGCAPPLFIRGIVATGRIEAGEELCRIPQRLHVDHHSIQTVLPELARRTGELSEVPVARANEISQATFLARLLTDAEDRAVAAARAADSKSQSSLPPPAAWALDGGSVSAQTVLVWERYADALLEEDFGTHPYRKAAADPVAMREAFEPSVEGEFMVEMAADIVAVHKVLTEEIPSELIGSRFEPEIFFRARLCMLTRIFQTDHDSALVPMADLFNHSGTKYGAIWSFDAKNPALVITASRVHDAGEEILISYGPRSNQLMNRTYGFTQVPEEEPGWTYRMTQDQVSLIYDTYLPENDRKLNIMLDSKQMDETLCNAINLATQHGQDAAEFIKLMCARCKYEYDINDTKMRPALEALARRRAKEPSCHQWWLELDDAHHGLTNDVPTRVKMGEYLCLVAHLEAVNYAKDAMKEVDCFAETAQLRETMRQGLSVASKGLKFKLVSSPS